MLKSVLVIILVLTVSQLQAQKKIYIKDSENKTPVQGVNIEAGRLNYLSNAEGSAVITAEDGDTVIFSSVGYKKFSSLYSNLKDKQSVLLIPAPVKTAEMVVNGKINAGSSFSEKILIPENAASVYENTAALLRTQSTFFVKDYGSAAAAKTVSARGMSSENTIVLFNEARINNIRSGAFDFQNVSLDNIERVDIDKTGGADGPFSGAGGVVKITTGNFSDISKAKFSARFSSDGLQSYSGGMKGLVSGRLYYSALVERTYSRNKFKYSFEGEDFERESASFNKTYTGLDLRYSTGILTLKNHFHYSYLNSGVPGAVVSNNQGYTKLGNSSKSFVNILNFDFLVNDKIIQENTAAFNTDDFTIYDPDKVLFYPSEKKTSHLYEYQLTNKISYLLGDLSLKAGNYFHFSNLKDKSNLNLIFDAESRYERAMERVFLSADYQDKDESFIVRNLRLSSSVFYSILNETADKKYFEDYATYRFGISFQPISSVPLTLQADYSKESREPSYCERFYSGIYRFGTSFLKNENYRCLNLGFNYEADIAGKSSFSFVYYMINADDKILWMPVSTLPGMQIPKNVGKVESSGIEIGLRKELPCNLSLSANYVYNRALNKNNLFRNDNSYNKQLVYTPEHRSNYSVTYSPGHLRIIISGFFAGESYFSNDNNRNSRLKSYFVNDLSVSYKFNTSFAGILAGFNIYNLLNQSYMIIQSYPMPERNYSFTLNMEI